MLINFSEEEFLIIINNFGVGNQQLNKTFNGTGSVDGACVH